jgi:hypothetical protein
LQPTRKTDPKLFLMLKLWSLFMSLCPNLQTNRTTRWPRRWKSESDVCRFS